MASKLVPIRAVGFFRNNWERPCKKPERSQIINTHYLTDFVFKHSFLIYTR